MPRLKTKYNVKWEDIIDNKGNKYSYWLKKDDDFTAYCIICETKIIIANAGKIAITKHAGTKKHLERLLFSSEENESEITEESHETK